MQIIEACHLSADDFVGLLKGCGNSSACNVNHSLTSPSIHRRITATCLGCSNDEQPFIVARSTLSIFVDRLLNSREGRPINGLVHPLSEVSSLAAIPHME